MSSYQLLFADAAYLHIQMREKLFGFFAKLFPYSIISNSSHNKHCPVISHCTFAREQSIFCSFCLDMYLSYIWGKAFFCCTSKICIMMHIHFCKFLSSINMCMLFATYNICFDFPCMSFLSAIYKCNIFSRCALHI